MKCGDSTIATKSVCSQIFQSSPRTVPAPDHIDHSKRSKRSSAARRPSSELRNINIDDLPDLLLAEILCRLPCYKFVSQCKCVSKHWHTLISDPYFIGRFLYLQRDHKQTPIGTVINTRGEEFLNRMSSSSKPLTQLFKRLVSFYSLRKEPAVLGTYNDLVLCCASRTNQRDYYICNPYTIQWVPLPPPPKVYKFVPVGFICDLPYYNYKEDDQKGHIIKLNAEYRCKVVRLIFDYKHAYSRQFKVQIFSSETGEWSESVVSSPLGAMFDGLSFSIGYAYNKMLYWKSDADNFIIGLDPFMINNSNSISLFSTNHSSNDDDITGHYKCCFIDCNKYSFKLECLGVNGGCLRMYDFNLSTLTLVVCDLKEEEQEDDQTFMIRGATGNLFFKIMKNAYQLRSLVPGPDAEVLAFDPTNGDISYIRVDYDILDSDILACNFRTREVSKIPKKRINCPYFIPLVLPWWPTPVPRLPQHAPPT